MIPCVLAMAVLFAGFATPPFPKELRYERRVVAESDNAFKLLELAASQFTEPAGNTNYAKIYADDGDWIDDDALEQFMEDRATTMELLQRAAQFKHLQFPENSGSVRFISLLRLQLVEAKRQYAKKNYESCARHLVSVVRNGDLMMHGDGTIMYYLVGSTVKTFGVNGARWLAGKSDVPTKVLLELNAQIESRDRDGGALADTLRREFKRVMHLLDQMKDNPIDILQQLNGGNDDLPLLYDALRKNPKTFDYNATFDLLVSLYRELVVESESAYVADKAAKLERRLAELDPEFPNLTSAATVPNAAGMRFVGLITRSPLRGRQLSRRTEVVTGCSQMLLALRAYANDHNDLPASIDQLVPKYLKSIPVDTFDGKPLRYSKAEKKVFSVGPQAPIEFAVNF